MGTHPILNSLDYNEFRRVVIITSEASNRTRGKKSGYMLEGAVAPILAAWNTALAAAEMFRVIP
jgi:hypothetical protein